MILTGATIQTALNRTTKPVELRDSFNARVRNLNAEEVANYVAMGFEVHGVKRRVRYLCPPKSKPDLRTFQRDDTFWAGRACLRFWGDQRSPGGMLNSRLFA